MIIWIQNIDAWIEWQLIDTLHTLWDVVSFYLSSLIVQFIINSHLLKTVVKNQPMVKLKCGPLENPVLWYKITKFTLSYSESLGLEFPPGNLTKRDSSGWYFKWSACHPTSFIFALWLKKKKKT